MFGRVVEVPQRETTPFRPRSPYGISKLTGFELVSGLERFYSDPANTTIPVGSAIRIYLLQASGKDQATIQELIDTARLLGAQSRRATAQR